MKVLLAQTNLDKLTERTSHPHAGLAYLGAYARHKRHRVRAVDAKFEGISNAEVLRRIVEFAPDVLGLTVRTPDIREAEKAAAEVKRLLPRTRILVGGAHVCGVGRRTLQEGPAFDVAVIGEGEEVFCELLEHFEHNSRPLSSIRGIIYRVPDGFVQTKERPPLADLDGLLYPAWDLFPARSHDIALFTSRGCPYQCIFCQRIMGGRVRTMSPARVVREILHDVERYGAHFLQIEDEVFGVNRKWLDETLDLMMERGLEKKIKWFANSRVNIADREVYRKMRAAGCVGLGFGIESGNQAVLDRIRKGITLEKAREAVALAKEAGLRTNSFFILGHPHETKESIRETINFACSLNTTEISFGIMVPYPGTGIYAMAKNGEGGYRSFHEDWEEYTKYFGRGLELEGLSSKDLKRYQKRAYMEFYLKNARFGDLLRIARKYMLNIPRFRGGAEAPQEKSDRLRLKQ